jgi:hypothetical protein
MLFVCLMVFNVTFNNISVISWWSVLLVEETSEKRRPAICHWQTLPLNVVSSTHRTAPLLADLLLYSYETNFIQGLLKKNEKKLAQSFKFTFCYIDDVLSLNYSRFGDFVDRIYPIELEIKDITDTDRSALYLDLHFKIISVVIYDTKYSITVNRILVATIKLSK